MKSSDGEHVSTDLPRVAAECRGDSADGQAEFEATVHQGPDGFWVAKAEKAAVPYEHPSPRIITHVGMFVYDRWLIDEMPKGRNMGPKDVATFTVEYPLPETL